VFNKVKTIGSVCLLWKL